MEPTIYKPSIYKGAGIYKTGGAGGDITSVNVGGVDYGVKKIGNLFWTTSNLKYHVSTYKYPNNDAANENNLGLLYKYKIVQNEIIPILPNGWRIPDKKDVENLISQYPSALNYIDESYGGDNISGFSAKFAGIINYVDVPQSYNVSFESWTTQYSFDSDLNSPVYIRNSTLQIKSNLIEKSTSLIDSKNAVYTSLSIRICHDE